MTQTLTADDQRQIELLLSHDLKVGQTLLEKLQAQSRAIVARKSELLLQIEEEKQPLLAALDSTAAKLSPFIVKCSRDDNSCLADTKQGAEIKPNHESLVQAALSESNRALWAELKTIVSRCQQQNDVNGKLVHHTQKRVAKVLSILQQRFSQTLYDHKGKNTHSTQVYTSITKV